MTSSNKRWADLVKHMGDEPKRELIKKARRLHDERMCKAKKRFYTRAAALTFATRRNSNRKIKLRAYQCAICKLWHLTSRGG